MTTYIKDLIDLPERVHGGDFVLKLTEGVEHPDETLRHYVVTPELARNFDDALDFIKGAVQSNSSKAAYLHGSFGSRQEPLHGGAAPAAAAAPGGEGEGRGWRRWSPGTTPGWRASASCWCPTT